MNVAWLHRHDLHRGGYWISLSLKSMSAQKDCVITPIYLGWRELILAILQKNRYSQYDIIHVWDGGLRSLIVGLALRGRGNSILQLSGSDWYGVPIGAWQYRITGMVNRLSSSVSIRFFRAVIVMSKRMAREMRISHQRKSIHVIPDAIDIGSFTSWQTTALEKRNRNFEAFGYYRVSIFCNDRGSSIKRPGLAARAVRRAQSISAIPIRFKWVRNIPKAEIPAEMSRTDLLLLTSTHEGFPNVIKEALASNTPFVATDVSDLADIARNTRTCFVANPRIDDLAQCIVRSLSTHDINEDLRVYASAYDQTKKDAYLFSVYKSSLSISPRDFKVSNAARTGRDSLSQRGI